MHVLYIHQYFATLHGKTSTRSYEMARRWAAAGHRVTMLTSTAQLTEADVGPRPWPRVVRKRIDGIGVVALRVPYHQTMGFGQRLWAFVSFMMRVTPTALLMHNVDVVFASSTPLTIGVPAMLSRWLRGRPYVFEVRDLWPAVPEAMGLLRSPLLKWPAHWLERLSYRNAASIVALAPGVAVVIRRQVSARTPVICVPNASDTEGFVPSLDGSATRARYGWGPRGEKIVFLHAGAMGLVNGLDAVVRAGRQLRDHPHIQFVLIGEGNRRPMLEKLVAELGVTNVQILPPVKKHETGRLFAAADVILVCVAPIPILELNSANKFFDGLAAGRPVLLNYGGWQREVLEETGAGLGCDQGDDAGFVAAVKRLADDAALREKMGEAARALALERYDRNDLAAQALDLLEQAAKR